MSIGMDVAQASDEVRRAVNIFRRHAEEGSALDARDLDLDHAIARRLIANTAELLVLAKAYERQLARAERDRERRMNEPFFQLRGEIVVKGDRVNRWVWTGGESQGLVELEVVRVNSKTVTLRNQNGDSIRLDPYELNEKVRKDA